MTFRDSYQNELNFLRQLGAEFASSNPALASFLSASASDDPDVERLLEGFAFLAARLQSRADAAVPLLSEALAEVLFPESLQPTPACSVVQLSPRLGALRSCPTLQPGLEVWSETIEGTACRFQTTDAVALEPVEVLETRLEHHHRDHQELCLRLRSRDFERRALIEHGSLRLFLNGPTGLCATFMMGLERHLSTIDICPVGSQDTSTATREAQDGTMALAPSLWRQPQPPPPPLWPRAAYAPSDARMLEEHFTLPERSFFWLVQGLQTLDAERLGDEFEIRFRFSGLHDLPPAVPQDLVQLHCVPVSNVFPCDADPISHRFTDSEHLIRAAGIAPAHAEVFAVDRVEGLRPHGGGRVSYSAYASFSGEQAGSPCYTLRRALSPLDDCLDLYIALPASNPRQVCIEEEVLSLALRCTNRMLPASLRRGSICRLPQGTPSVAGARNLCSVSKPVTPPISSELMWRFIDETALSLGSLHRPETHSPERLQALLRRHNAQARARSPQGRTNAKRIDAIRRLLVEPTQRLTGGVPLRGVALTVEFDEAAFASLGDLYLFACQLDAFLAHQVPINTFTVLQASLYPSGGRLLWPPRVGHGTLI